MTDFDFWSDANFHHGELKEAKIGGKSADPVVGELAQVNGRLFICIAAATTEPVADAVWSELGSTGSVDAVSTQVDLIKTALGWDSTTGDIDDTVSGKLGYRVKTLETAVGASDDTAAADGSLYARIKTKQDLLTAGNGISIGTVSSVPNTIYLATQSGVASPGTEVGSATAIPKITVNAQGIVTKTDSVAVYPPTSVGTSGQYWKSQGSGEGIWTTPAETMTVKSSAAAAKLEIPSSYAVQNYVDEAVTSVYKFKGSMTVGEINALSRMVEGDVYNVEDSGTITNSGHTAVVVAAGDNIAWTTELGWDKMGAIATVDYPVDGATIGGNAATVTGKKIVLGAAAGLAVDTSAFTTSGDTTVPTGKLVASKIADKMDKFGTTPAAANKVVVTKESDADTIDFMTGNLGGTAQPVYVDGGELKALSATVGGTAQPIYLNAGVLTAGTALGTASTLAKQEQGSATDVVLTAEDAKLPTSAAVKYAVDKKVNANDAITAGTACKITYDAKGLVTAGAGLAASDIPTITASKISDLTATVNAAFVDVTFSTAILDSETNTYTFTTTRRAHGVMILDETGVQCYAVTKVGDSTVTVSFNTIPANINSYKLSYIIPIA